MRFGLVIFDCDGVLVDSEYLGHAVIADAMREQGLEIAVTEAMTRFRGRRMAECVLDIERELGRRLPEGFAEDLRARMLDRFREDVTAIEGIEEVIDMLDIPYCVASNGQPEKIRVTLGVSGLLERFAGRIFSAYEVGFWKPDPGLFLHAAAHFGVEPARCAVIEDSLAGIRAALAAGMRPFGYVPPGGGSARIDIAGVVTFSSMRELPTLLDLREMAS